MTMLDTFIADRRPRWQRLESLISRARRGQGTRLSAAELEELGRAYRLATSDLAIARRDFPRDRVTRYLDGLVNRAHPVVYRQGAHDWSSLGRFVTHGFPRAFRESGRYTALAFALFAVPFLIAMLGTLADPTIGRMILPGGPFVEQVEQGQSWLEIERAQRSLAASSIATNNIGVTFLAFAGGVLFGIGTVFVLILNGLQIGAVAGLASSYGLGDELGDFVLGHGGVELSVIFIAGGAGLRMGHALLRPGFQTRRVALTHAGQRAIRLLAGCVPLLLIAGTIEGFISPSGLPSVAKLSVGLGSTALLYAYVLFAGREGGSDRAETS